MAIFPEPCHHGIGLLQEMARAGYAPGYVQLVRHNH